MRNAWTIGRPRRIVALAAGLALGCVTCDPTPPARYPTLETDWFHIQVAANEHWFAPERNGQNGIVTLVPHRSGLNIIAPDRSGLNFEHIRISGMPSHLGNFEPRNHPMILGEANDGVVLLQRETAHSHLSTKITFSVRQPWYLDQTVELTPHRRFVEDSDTSALAAVFASYLHQPDDHHLYLRPDGLEGEPRTGWYGVTKTSHSDSEYVIRALPEERLRGVADHLDAMARKVGPDSTATLLEHVPPGTSPLHFYYGHLHDGLIFLQMFAQPEGVRLEYSPVGGGDLDPNANVKPSPAWDYVLVHPNVEVGETYRWNTSVVVKPFRGREDILEEVRNYLHWVAQKQSAG